MLDILWTEKYRPTTMEEVALSEENRSLLQALTDAEEIPHLLFHGPPGCGKTTVSKILIGQLDCAVLRLNASSDRGIDVVRDRVKTFARTQLGYKWNIVFLDEADKLTNDAQTALRNTMESYAAVTRFILTCNYLHKIIDPIQSRCTPIELSTAPLKARHAVLRRILEAEEVLFEPQVVVGYAERFTDLRKMINAAQKRVLSVGSLDTVEEAAASSGPEIYEALGRRDWHALVSLSRTAGFDHQQALVDLFWAIKDDHPLAHDWRASTAKAYHESGFTPDLVVHFLGHCAGLIGG